MRFILPLLPLVCFELPSLGQAAAPADEKRVAANKEAAPPIPLLGLLNSLPQRSSLDDSLARRYHARNRVKTVAVIRLAPDGTATDTLDYAELDRAGYPVLTSKPSFRARSHFVYNRRHQLISYTKDAEPGFAMVMQGTYDPATRTTTLRIGSTLATLALYEIAHDTPRNSGKDSAFEAFFMAVPGLPPPPINRVLLTTKQVGGDTTRVDLLGYRNEEVVHTESHYTIGRAPRQRENGTIELPTVGRSHRESEGRYLPSQRHSYSAAGWLLRTQYTPPPPGPTEKSAIRASDEGTATITTKPVADTLTTTYLRNSDGQLRRQEHQGKTYGKWASPPFTAYDYSPNGLRRTRTDNNGTRYEYRYTFY